MDVTSLYTNIDTQRGLEAVEETLKAHRPDKLLMELLEIYLTCNNFEFNGKFYLQVKGTAMGKSFSPAYANIYMPDWETSVFQKRSKHPLIYLRYLGKF